MFNKKNRQHGVTLLESLIAIVLAALGVIGMIGIQLRTLADTQNTVRREHLRRTRAPSAHLVAETAALARSESKRVKAETGDIPIRRIAAWAW
ncbi:prepilin-type N-terminal cleavage/methylation domain-containing protein [Comamonas odontotermitis]|uniref:prepilin-type N-terminal cleavage/methylation domain-containing protein n=1 Tax=Comamonas odontotermitis TaxID=379895 RepID=UPI0037BFC536